MSSPNSPCIGRCQLDESGSHCVGCRRTLDEIAGWSTFSDEQKQAVWKRLLALPMAERSARCPRCGAAFACGSGGQTGSCWCMDLPAVSSPLGADSDCLCPSCLEAELRSLRAMTLNERLSHLGLFDAFDAAVAAGEADRLAAVLRQALLDDEGARSAAGTILAHPERYGLQVSGKGGQR